ncbi:alcohol dehydrogenase catalytic domain-containing protein [Homoserinibacter sp. GY 40078]|uniref:alcohol dehydrogenase catalytic domain-containing protein n=1 Tax=Homoserinibacter sp. GY 40078 TaxID=2603275 RepID=UPI0011CB8496|nr:alcohol dehydrogenase catalytic domain-containing protein [Homoserinibacter sp. GY 40078]TXK19105.1 alcohol dehydrogenase catalytic domain-containing protein [Homoserinibacter sp. GY 40078]
MQITGAVLERSGAPRPYTESHPITIDELQLDPPGPDEVLVRIGAAGVCHSDLSVVNGDRPRPLPMLLGHEAAGTVVEIGDRVRDLAVGDTVVASFLPRCGECRECRTDGRVPCSRGSAANAEAELLGGGRRLSRGGEPVGHHLGVSGFATHAVVHRSSLVSVGEGVPYDVAALMGCAVLTGGGAVVNAARPEPGQSVVVVGLGGVGLAAILTALAHDDVQVIGVDMSPAKLESALGMGAHAVYTPDDAVAAGVMGDAVIEAAGSARAFETAVALTGVGGATVTVGLPRADAVAEISPLALVSGARSIVGSYLGSAVPSRDIPRFVEWWRAGRLPVERLISGRVPLSELNAAMDDLSDGTALRQIVTTD